MFKLVLEKAKEPEVKLPTSAGLLKKQESSRKTSISAVLTMSNLWVWITINCGKFWKRWEYQTTWPASREICMQFRKQQLELGMEQQTVSKRKRSMSRLYPHNSFLWPCQLLWHLETADSGTGNFRPTPYVILPHRAPYLCTSMQLLFLLQRNPAHPLPFWSLLALITVCCMLLSPRVYKRLLLVLYCFLSLLPLGSYIVCSGRTWFHYCQMISFPCKALYWCYLGVLHK